MDMSRIWTIRIFLEIICCLSCRKEFIVKKYSLQNYEVKQTSSYNYIKHTIIKNSYKVIRYGKLILIMKNSGLLKCN